jgi:pyruvate-formate lyase-activating enzyme
MAAERLTQEALRLGAPMVASTYNEALITSEWAVEVFRHAKAQGLTCAYISNGNDTSEELRRMAEFLVSISPQIPWHVTAFHQDYHMRNCDETDVKTLVRAAEIGV